MGIGMSADLFAETNHAYHPECIHAWCRYGTGTHYCDPVFPLQPGLSFIGVVGFSLWLIYSIFRMTFVCYYPFSKSFGFSNVTQ